MLACRPAMPTDESDDLPPLPGWLRDRSRGRSLAAADRARHRGPSDPLNGRAGRRPANGA